MNLLSGEVKKYLKKAEEFFETMEDSYSKGRFNSTVSNAIHCAISSADALTVFYKGVWHAGERHEDVISLINSLGLENVNKKNRQLLNLLQIKNSAEYEETLMNESNALNSTKNAEKFYSWVKELLKE